METSQDKKQLDPKAYGKNGFKYKPKFGVIIVCDDEHHQQSVYNTLKQQGYKLKVVVI